MSTKKAPPAQQQGIPAVQMPAGSVDMDKFLAAAEGAEGLADPEKRDKKIADALEGALVKPEGDQGDPSLRPDQKLVEVERPDLGEGVTQQVRVHDAKSEAAQEGEQAAEQEEQRQEAATAGNGTNEQQEG